MSGSGGTGRVFRGTPRPLASLAVVLRSLLFAGLIGVAAAGCDALPRDSQGALQRVRTERVLRAGAAANPPWVTVTDGRVGGVEPALVEAFAASQGARVEWRTGPQIELSEQLHKRQFEVLVAGLDQKTPLASKVSLSQTWAKTPKEDGGVDKRAIAVMPGESRLLLALDRFLLDSPAGRQARAEAERGH